MLETSSCCPEDLTVIFWVGCGNLNNVTLVLLGVRALTEEEQLYLRLGRLGKYFSTGEEICTY
jgi:hypothetical protein